MLSCKSDIGQESLLFVRILCFRGGTCTFVDGSTETPFQIDKHNGLYLLNLLTDKRHNVIMAIRQNFIM